MLDGITDSMGLGLSEFRELVMDREACVLQSMGPQRVGHDCFVTWDDACQVCNTQQVLGK